MTTPLRRIFGGSDRPHHLAMATAVSMPVALCYWLKVSEEYAEQKILIYGTNVSRDCG
jgi:hypothetical protein